MKPWHTPTSAPTFHLWACTYMNYVHLTHFPLLCLNSTNSRRRVLIHLSVLSLCCVWEGVGTEVYRMKQPVLLNPIRPSPFLPQHLFKNSPCNYPEMKPILTTYLHSQL